MPDYRTVPDIEKASRADSRVRGVLNTTGAARRTRSGSASTSAKSPVTVTMADGKDDPRDTDELARASRAGRGGGGRVPVHARRAAGGRPAGEAQALSRVRGQVVAPACRVGTRDATNSFKAYSTDFVRQALALTRGPVSRSAWS